MKLSRGEGVPSVLFGGTSSITPHFFLKSLFYGEFFYPQTFGFFLVKPSRSIFVKLITIITDYKNYLKLSAGCYPVFTVWFIFDQMKITWIEASALGNEVLSDTLPYLFQQIVIREVSQEFVYAFLYSQNITLTHNIFLIPYLCNLTMAYTSDISIFNHLTWHNL